MTTQTDQARRPGPGRAVHGVFAVLSRAMAVLGGLMLSALILLVCASVTGRALNGALHSDLARTAFPDAADALIALGVGPVRGDFELVEAGIAFTIFAFLPLCQIAGAHASVDIFTARLSPRADRIRQMLTDAVFAAVLVLIAAQLWAGTASKMRTGQTTVLIEFPLWWAYALSLSGALIAAAVALYVAAIRVAELRAGRAILLAGDMA